MEDERIITPLPKALPISGVICLVLGIVMIPMVPQVFTEQQLSKNAILSGIPFILVFAAIIIFFMSFIWFLSNKLNFRVSDKAYNIIEKITIAGIVVGIVFMFQPWVFVLFRYGFYLLLVSTLAFIVWSHITAAPPVDELAGETAVE